MNPLISAGKGVHIFLKVICPKVDIIALLDISTGMA